MQYYEGIEKHVADKGFIHIRRSMKFHECIFMTKGVMYLAQDGEEFTVNKGDLVHFSANHMHYGWKESEGPVEFWWIHFLTDDPSDAAIPLHTKMQNYSYILQLFLQLKEVRDRSREDAECALTLLLHGIRHEIENGGNFNNWLANSLSSWIENNCTQNISVKDIADKFGYNSDYLSRCLKRKLNMSIKQYIMYCRLQSAKSLLVLTDLPLSIVAASCGFGDKKQFARYFKAIEKMTPSEYKKIYSEK